jgi:hypothetical protein
MGFFTVWPPGAAHNIFFGGARILESQFLPCPGRAGTTQTPYV